MTHPFSRRGLLTVAAGSVLGVTGCSGTEDREASVEAAGAPVSFHDVPGDHSAIIDPTSEAWSTVARLLGD